MTAESAGPQRLGRGAVRRRSTATGAVLVLLLLGSWIGSDDDFPVGSFRMYAGRNPVDGVVDSTYLLARTAAAGALVRVPDDATGYRRAELEGQLEVFLADPDRLQDVAEAHAAHLPADPPYVEVRLMQRRYSLHDRRIVQVRDVRLATWRAG